MDAFDIVGLLPTLIEIVRDRVVGYDDQIMKRFDHAIAKALKPTARYDDVYIKNAMLHVSELIGLLVQAFDNPVGIEDIELTSYINKEEFRRFYNQTQKDKELVNVLKDEWNYYISKDTNNRVKTIQAEIVILADEIKKVGEGVGEVKEDTEKIQKGLSELKGDVDEGINKIINRLDEKEDKKGGNRNEDLRHLCDCLKEKLENKRKHHPSFRLMDIDENLFPDGMITFDTEARDSNNELKTISKIVAESWERDETNHLMIEGEGGIGKTVTLLSLPDKFALHPVPAIYIPLHELKEDTNTIEKYIKNRVLDSKEQQYDLLQEVVKKPWNDGPNVLLLLDGFNEISIEMRGSISEDIEQWSERTGLQIITSSRYDIHQYVALRSSFSKIELQPLSEETVLEYLENNKIGIPENNTVIKLITIPLLLALFIKAEAIRNDRPSRFAKFLDTKNAGLLIWNYLQCELWRFKNKKEEAKASVLAMEFMAPYIAWTMQQHSEFVLDESTFLDRIEEAYNLMKRHIEAHGQLPEHIKTTLQQSKGLPDYDCICDLLKEQLCLFIGNEGEYRLMHQQFRDALAALHLINSSYLSGESLPEEWKTSVDHYVMGFVADLMSEDEDEAKRLWEQNRKTKPTIENATRNQLRLQGVLHNNDFSHLDFGGLDLSNISLYPYRIGMAQLKMPTLAKQFEGTVISKKTFSVESHSSSVNAVAVSPDGSRIVSGSSDCTIRIWDMYSGDCLKTLEGHQGGVTSVAVLLDGRRIVSGSSDYTIRIWDMDSGDCLKTLDGHQGGVTSVAVSPDGWRIVSGSWDHTIRIWDIDNGDCLKALEGHQERVDAVAVSTDGRRIVSGSMDRTIHIWDMDSGDCLKTLEGHQDWVGAVAVFPDGRRIVSGSDDRTIRIWDIDSGDCLKTLEGHQGGVRVVAVTIDGRSVISGSAGTIRIWDTDSGNCFKTLKRHQGGVDAVAVSIDGRRIVSGSGDSTIRIWDTDSGGCLRTLEGYRGWMNAVAVSTDGRRIVSGSDDRTIRIWDMGSGGCIKTLEGHKRGVTAVAVSIDGRRIVSGSNDCTIRIWDVDTGDCLKTLEGHQDCVRAVAVSIDGRRIVSGSMDETIRIWDMYSGVCLIMLDGHHDWVRAVAVFPDGRRIVSGSRDETIRIWGMESGDCLKKLNGHQGGVRVVAVTPDGRRVISGSTGTIRIWDVDSGDCLEKLEGHQGGVRTVAVFPDDRHVVSGSYDDTIRIWDMDSGDCLKILDGYEDWVTTVAVSPDGRRIVSGFDDETIRIWDVETGENIHTIRALPLSLVGLDFSKAKIPDEETKELFRQNGAKV